MPRLYRMDAHGRGLVVLALALAAWLALAASRCHGQASNVRDFEALATGPLPSQSGGSPRRTFDVCGDSAESGESACASPTGGPSGGTGS